MCQCKDHVKFLSARIPGRPQLLVLDHQSTTPPQASFRIERFVDFESGVYEHLGSIFHQPLIGASKKGGALIQQPHFYSVVRYHGWLYRHGFETSDEAGVLFKEPDYVLNAKEKSAKVCPTAHFYWRVSNEG